MDFTEHTLKLDTTEMSVENLDTDAIKKIRVGIFLFPVLLKRFRELEIPYPGGCNIGKRPIDEHLHAFETFGYVNESTDDVIRFSGNYSTENVRISA